MKLIKLTTLALLITAFSMVISGCIKKPVTTVIPSNVEGSNVNQPVNQNPSVNSGQATTTAEIDTSNWKTYRNEQYGFELKYPRDWMLSNVTNGISVKYTKKWEFGMKEGFTPFSVVITSQSLSDFVKSYEGDFLDGAPLTRIISQKSYLLDGKLGTMLVGNNAEGINSYYIFLMYHDRNYLVSFNENEKVQLGMLSTLHFIN